MAKIIITRKQFERLREIFEMYDTLDQVVVKEENSNGIGSVTTVEFDPKATVRVDITDMTIW